MGNIFGAVVGGLGDLISGHLGAQSAQRRQEDAQNFSAQQFATRYQTTVKDMQAAGLNPMLAYQQGGGAAPSGTGASGGDYGRVGSSIVQGRLNSAQAASAEANIENVKAQTEQIRADTALKRAQMYEAEARVPYLGASANQAAAMTGQIEAAHKKILEEIKNIPKEGARLDALVKNLGVEFHILEEKGLTQQQITGQMRMLARKLLLEGDLLELDIDAAKLLDNIGRESAQLKPIVDIVRLLMRR